MKAPDKIYMPNELLSEEWQRHIEGDDTEYIRKDLLLEWLEGKKKHYMDRQEYDCGWNDLLDDIIDKLNSL